MISLIHFGLLLLKIFLIYLILKGLASKASSEAKSSIADSVQNMGLVIFLVPVAVLVYGLVCFLVSDWSIIRILNESISRSKVRRS